MFNPPSPPSGFRWDGTITAGNLLTAISMGLALVVWGVRLEARVDQEIVLRQKLEGSTTQAFDSLKVDQASAIARIEARIGDEATIRRNDEAEIKLALRNIDDRLAAVLLAISVPQRQVRGPHQ
jgi:hypothetical protein